MRPRLCVDPIRVAALLGPSRPELADPATVIGQAEAAGADGIVLTLAGRGGPAPSATELRRLCQAIHTRTKIRTAPTEELVALACELCPDCLMLVRRPRAGFSSDNLRELGDEMVQLASAVDRAKRQGVAVGLSIEPDRLEVETAHLLGADQVALDVARFGSLPAGSREAQAELDRLHRASVRGHELGLDVVAGGGITLGMVAALARLGVVVELDLGQALTSPADQGDLAKALARVRFLLDPSAG